MYARLSDPSVDCAAKSINYRRAGLSNTVGLNNTVLLNAIAAYMRLAFPQKVRSARIIVVDKISGAKTRTGEEAVKKPLDKI